MKSLRSYKSFNDTRLSIAKQLREYSEKTIGKNAAEVLNEYEKLIREGRFRISVFGTFSNGKSTLMNALMEFDREILVVDELASTAAITAIQMPTEESLRNKALITYRDQNRKAELIPIEEVKNYTVKIRGSAGEIDNTNIEDEIKEVRLYINSPLLDNGVEIIDTPGLNSVYDEHTKIAKGIMKKSDAAIFVFTFDQAGTKPEMEILDSLSETLYKAFFALNKIDLADENRIDYDERIDLVQEELLKKLHEKNITLGDGQVYPISARWAFEAYCEKEPREKDKKMNKSRFLFLTSALEEYLCSDKFMEDRILSPLNKLKTKLVSIADENQKQIEAAGKNQEEINYKISEINKKIEKEKERVNKVTRDLNRNIKSEFLRKKTDLAVKSDETAKKIITEISQKKSAYSMDRYQKSDYGKRLSKYLLNYWGSITNELISQLSDIVEETLYEADESELSNIKNELTQLVSIKLNLENFEHDQNFKVDFSELDKFKRELEAKEKKKAELAGKISKLSQESQKRKLLENDYQSLKADVSEIKKDIYALQAQKLEIRDDVIMETKYKREDRKGFFGAIGNFLFGGKRVQYQEQKVISERADRDRIIIDEGILNRQILLDEAQEELNKKEKQMIDSTDVDINLENSTDDFAKLIQDMGNLEIAMEDSRDEIEQEQLQEKKQKMEEEVESYVDSFITDSARKLDQIGNNAAKYAEQIVRKNNTALEMLKTERDNLLELLVTEGSQREKIAAEKKENNSKIFEIINELNRLIKDR